MCFIFIRKKHKRSEIIEGVITNAIEPYGAKITSFFYDEKCFGNIILSIENKDGKILNFYLDRGYAYLEGDKYGVNVVPKNPDGGYSDKFNFIHFVVNKVNIS